MFLFASRCCHAGRIYKQSRPLHIQNLAPFSFLACSSKRATSHVRVHPRYANVNVRTKKTKTCLQVDNLLPAEAQLELPPPLADDPDYPTVIKQARSNMLKFENCVVLTKVGGFYELHFEHAEKYGPLLNLKLAQKKTKAGPVPFTGFPFFQLDRFLKILVQDLNCFVAIAEEYPNDAAARDQAGGLLHDRKVSRVITPGTLIDETFMDPYSNNYVLAIHMQDTDPVAVDPTIHVSNIARPLAETHVGLAWLDLSTGSFYTQSGTLASIPSAISRIGPLEIVLDKKAGEEPHDSALISALAEDKTLVTHCSTNQKTSVLDWLPMLEGSIPESTVSEFTPEEISAGNILLQYVETRLQGNNTKLQHPIRYRATDNMVIDRNTMKALELKEKIRDSSHGATRGTLLHAVRRTVTKSGARLLDDWLSAPSTILKTIESRLDLVTYMLENAIVADRVVHFLQKSHDSKRLVQKFALGRGDPDDLLALAATIRATKGLFLVLEEAMTANGRTGTEALRCLTSIIERIQLDGPKLLAEQIQGAIDEDGLEQQNRLADEEAGSLMDLAEQVASEEGSSEDVVAVTKKNRKRKRMSAVGESESVDPVSKPKSSVTDSISTVKPGRNRLSIKELYATDGDQWTMRPAASTVLYGLHDKLNELMSEKSALTDDLKTRLGASVLTLRWSPGLGHICHVKGKGRDTLDSTDIKVVSSSKSTRSLHHPEWTALGRKIDEVKTQILAEEQVVFLKLREQVILNLVKLRRNAVVLDELDIACSFATLAKEQDLVRPNLNDSAAHKIVGGRHPTVQFGLQESGRSFISNDCFVGDQERVWFITGPNMAGKSTFLRQNALITIMAQVGSYVPAEYAEIGIVDQIFSRVGSADNLFRDQSTFMVEMLETAMILKNATPHSFVIMDEIGRGTTPEDGTAVAFACLHHLYHVNKCRTLFATHFHAIADMASGMRGIGYYCTDVKEDKFGGFSYVHKLRKGVNKQSHALKVAKLAGVPDAAIEVARQVLSQV